MRIKLLITLSLIISSILLIGCGKKEQPQMNKYYPKKVIVIEKQNEKTTEYKDKKDWR